MAGWPDPKKLILLHVMGGVWNFQHPRNGRLYRCEVDSGGNERWLVKAGSTESRWISQAEAARLRGVSSQTISQAIAQKRLKTEDCNGRPKLCRSDVVALKLRLPQASRKDGNTMVVTFEETPEWVPIQRGPDQPMRTVRTSGNEAEYVTSRGVRYLLVRGAHRDQWFSRTGRRVTYAEKAGLQVCCSKFRISWGKCLERKGAVTERVVIFAKDLSPSQHLRRFEIKFCPFCGKRIRFLSEPEEPERPQVRAVSAGRQA